MLGENRKIDSSSNFITQQLILLLRQLISDARKYISAKIIPDESSSADIAQPNNKFSIKATCLSFITEEGTIPDYTDICVDHTWRQVIYIHMIMPERNIFVS